MKLSPGLHVLPPREAPSLDATFTVRVFVPSAPASAWSLLLMQDGQNLFDASAAGASWGVDETVEQLVREGDLPPTLVVGVEHRGSYRLGDYSPWPDPRLPLSIRGEPYARFLVEELLPALRASLPLREGPEHVAVAGSSMGGLLSLYLAQRYPERVGRVAALSPTAMLGRSQLAQRWTAHPRSFQKVYLDAGEHELFDTGWFVLDYGRAAVELHAHLASLGYGPHELRLVREPGGQHTESAWRRRFPAALRWLFR